MVIAARGQGQRRLEPCTIAVVQLEHGVAGAHLVAGLREDHDADRGIDRILDPVAAGAERDRRAADQLGVEARHVAGSGGGHDMPVGARAAAGP